MTIRIKRPDTKNAQSILDAAKREMDFTLSIVLSDASCPTIVRNIYESFRMIGDALLIAKGIESTDHLAPIQELLTLQAHTQRPIALIDNLRRLRHNVNYYGYRPTLAEGEDVLSIAKACFKPLLSEAEKKISLPSKPNE